MAKAHTAGWNQSVSTPVVLVSGPEEFLASRSIRATRERLKLADPMLEVTEIDAGDYGSGAIFDLTSPSLFNEPRLLIIRSVEKCTDALIEDGPKYLADPTSETTVIFRHSSGVRGKKLLEALRASDLVTEVNCQPIKKDQERVDFVKTEFASAKKQINQAAIRALVDAFNDDLAELSAACQQLIQDSAANVDEALVDRYYSGRVETNAFKAADAAIAGRTGEALALLRHAISSGGDPVPMVAAVAMRMRILAKVYGSRALTPAQIGAEPWAIEKAKREVAGWTEDGLAAVIQEIAACDAAAKGAERDPIFALERLMILISNRGN
ncbi:MAG: DNA polymerase III subunit delta [Micrococcales bacterium]